MLYIFDRLAVSSTELVLQLKKFTKKTFVLTLGTKGRLELDARSCVGRLARVSSECKYAGCLYERA